jgi:hypothetical protein
VESSTPDARLHQVKGRRPDWKLLFASLGIAAGLVFVVFGVSRSVTGRDEQKLPDAIESVQPIRGATQAPQQTQVFVDLQEGYRASLTIDDIALETVSLDELGGLAEPGQQITLPPKAVFETGNDTISYTPVEDGPIESFSTGIHTATVFYWLATEGPARARSYTWTFYVV